MNFPNNFTWGAAAAAYQIEGAWNEDGRGPSVWDVFSQTPGRVFENHNGNVACDHYHRWREDVALMKELGIKAYRLSLSWSRIMPDGTGAINEAGLKFYDELIDGLLAAGIQPWVTLFHWDMPQALQEKGGFLNRDMADWFGAYATVVAKRLGDRVKHWMTINEPPVIVGLGYQEGVFAPGLKCTHQECLLAAHNLLRAHGSAVQALRAHCVGPQQISIAHTSREPIPATRADADVEAARARYFGCVEERMWNLAWWADPIAFGKYPEEGLKNFAGKLPKITDADMALISQPIDYLAYNCYSGFKVAANDAGKAVDVPNGHGIGNARGTLPWLSIAPDAIYWAARWQTERYNLPIVFSENGFCNTDFVQLDGKVHDPQRIDFVTRYLDAVSRAIADGADVGGYFYWSILDNFEWAEGYKDRFGLVHVDYETQVRTPKDSFYWYRDLIARNGALS
ncbi:GH1 family beta-glucosidase [Synoicihabitans lomoniglobus]|uniref:Beta-glucosidase n=1 Tax=Synoicihabitans lomoniglobus TaxID=2909285 RepID=A0AAE9ZUI1_9BACT|nr:GH1 family beta-glucosidase [Opitutaceae bacterium LMO-M01]WED63025.1 GH1 family beta-glucosidase [Opitutaceae bacterium LMO-M01]